MTTSTSPLPAGQYRVTGAPVFGTSSRPSSRVRRGELVRITAGNGEPDYVGDVFVRTADASGVYLRASSLTPTDVLVEGLRVRVPGDIRTQAGGRVFFGNRDTVAEVTCVPASVGYAHDVEVRAVDGPYAGQVQTVDGRRLTVLGFEPAPATVRKPITFAAAYEKAVAHRGTPTSAKQVAKTVRLAELLIEVSA